MTTTQSKTKRVKKSAVQPVATVEAKTPDAPGSTPAARLARAALLPSANAALVVDSYVSDWGEQDVGALMAELSAGIKDVWAGDAKRAEAMLYGQAHALQAIFMNLAKRATKQEYLNQWEAYLRMALKAQSQCRATLETLAAIKNPPVVFARQANINNGGQQQVNNGPAPVFGLPKAEGPAQAHAGETESPRCELLEVSNGQGMDTGATGAAGGADSHLAPVGSVNRSAHGAG